MYNKCKKIRKNNLKDYKFLLRDCSCQKKQAECFKLLEYKDCQLRILYLIKSIFKNDGKIKTFLDEGKVKEFVTSRSRPKERHKRWREGGRRGGEGGEIDLQYAVYMLQPFVMNLITVCCKRAN